METHDEGLIGKLLRLKEDLLFQKIGLLDEKNQNKKKCEIDVSKIAIPKIDSISSAGNCIDYKVFDSLREEIKTLNQQIYFPAFLDKLNDLFRRLLLDKPKIVMPKKSLEKFSCKENGQRLTAVFGELDPKSDNVVIIDGVDSYSQNAITTLKSFMEEKIEFNECQDLKTVDLFFILLRNEVLCKRNNQGEKTFLKMFEYLIIRREMKKDGAGKTICTEQLIPIRQSDIIHPEEDLDPKPIIFIGMEDVISFDFENESQSTIVEYYRRVLDRRIRFIDSSIWQRYVPISVDSFLWQIDNYQKLHTLYGATDFRYLLFKTIDDIFYSNCLYKTIAAREYLDFQCRILHNDHVVRIKNDHTDELIPFSFHSERIMSEKFEKEKQDIQNKYHSFLKWRFLLIDDYAMRNLPTEDNDTIKITKCELISRLLNLRVIESDDNKISEMKDRTDWGVIKPASFETFDTVSFLESAKSKLTENQFDIIVLDHLLSRNQRRREYGYEFFKKYLIKENKTLMEKKGPFGKFWIFPISNIAVAVIDSLREEGIDNLNENWHISNGGDPINTPYFFCNNIFRFMQQQISEAHFTAETILDFLEIHLKPPKPPRTDEGKEDDFLNNISRWATGFLGFFIYSFGTHEMLYNDSESAGSFLPSFSSTMQHYLHTMRYDYESAHNLYEHIRQLLYSIAYGSSALWEEALEELDFLDDILKKTAVPEGKEYPWVEKGIITLRKYLLEIRRSR